MTNKNRTNTTYKSIATLLIVFGFISFSYASPISNNNLVMLANNQRANYKINQLNASDQLNQAASAKASAMFKQNAFEHTLPNGATPWDFINNSGYRYEIAGENLAINFQTAEGTTSAWMNSPSHRANILSNKYEDIGIAVESGQINGKNTVLVVEMFGKRSNSIVDKVVDMFGNLRYLFGL